MCHPEQSTATSKDLPVRLAGVDLKSPLVLASGILGVTASSLKMVADAGAGAVTLKSCSVAPRLGHPGPCVLPLEHGLLNAVGLSNPGARQTAHEIRDYISRCPTPVIASVFASTVEQFGEVTEIVGDARPHLIEVNVSCPNVESEFGTPFGADEETLAAVTRKVKRAAGDTPVSVKLTPNCPSIARMAAIAEQFGADAITAINSVGPGMIIDLNTRTPVLSNRAGGLSGPAILPVAVRCVYDIYKAVGIPIIGTGGVSSAADALQMILAGATAVAVGTAVYTRGVEVFGEINRELGRYLEEENISSLDALRGAAHG